MILKGERLDSSPEALWKLCTADIAAERLRQNELHGKKNYHSNWLLWNAVLTEEVGEFAQAILDDDLEHIYEEITHVAAVAEQIMERIQTYAAARRVHG